ncbi:MAG TPA: hypothetical protein VFN56_02540 [Candidatus Saccharimonadales bacterium]|nr:hypothetical protein [Candidatus Saccharimonadales bacterium]
MHNRYPTSGEDKVPALQATGPRFNLSQPAMRNRDTIIENAGSRFRLIQYDVEPSRHNLFLALLNKKLILGEYLSSTNTRSAIFSVPLDARPLAFEVGTSRQGEFTYGDSRLFSELGGLLAITARVTNGMVLPSGSISRSVAFVDFTRPDEHNLYLVPGVERIFNQGSAQNLSYYIDNLSRFNEMGKRFDAQAAAHFTEGFVKVMSKDN